MVRTRAALSIAPSPRLISVGARSRPMPIAYLDDEDSTSASPDDFMKVWRLKDVPRIETDAERRMTDALDQLEPLIQTPQRRIRVKYTAFSGSYARRTPCWAAKSARS